MLKLRTTGSKSSGSLSWFIQRVSGLVLVIMLLLHFGLMHYVAVKSPDGFSFQKLTFDVVKERLASPYWKAFDITFLILAIYHGLNEGEVAKKDIWQVFRFNNELYCLTLTREHLFAVFGESFPIEDDVKSLKMAVNAYHGEYLIQQLQLPESTIDKTGKYEMALLIHWLKTQ